MSRKISRYHPELNTITKYVGAEIFNSRWPKFCFDDISEVVESYGICVRSVKTDAKQSKWHYRKHSIFSTIAIETFNPRDF